VARRREDRLRLRPADRRGRELRLPASRAGQRASEVLMHRYYWAAKAVTQLEPDPDAEHRGAHRRHQRRAPIAAA
jgi:UTP:GlnB (protein PII) uridylyltransferase